MTENQVLLIYEEVPENTRMFLFPASDRDLERLRLCHDKFINSDDEPELDWMYEQIEGAWKPFEIFSTRPLIIDKAPVTVVLSGFIL